MTKFVIAGRPNCKYCTAASNLAAKLKERRGIDFEYVLFGEDPYTKTFFEEIAGKTVQTVPQILVETETGKEYIGGFDDFFKYAQKHKLI